MLNSRPHPTFLGASLVIIPALNEASCVAGTVHSWLHLGAAQVRVVDNGSTDNTAAIARRAGAEAVVEPARGYGAAAWRGLQNCPAAIRWVLFSSADGSDRLSIEELAAWNDAVQAGADLVMGDRVTFPESRGQLKWSQQFGNWITCRAIGAGWGQHFKDMGSLRLARPDGLLALGLRDRAFGWNVEMQVRALEQRWKIVELPVRFHPRIAGTSKISGNLLGTIRAGRGILQTLCFLMVLRATRARRPSASSLPGLAASKAVRSA